jgi:phosphoribosylaminoimidazole-succinocarboxamide synthase
LPYNGGVLARSAATISLYDQPPPATRYAPEEALHVLEPSGLRPDAQGKVRDLYDLGDRLLLVASDRISAFDFVLPDPIPFKGEVLTKLSLFWFDLLADVVPNHLLSADVADLPDEFARHADWLRGRFMLVKKARVYPVECIVRGYLAGSGLKEYQRQGTVCGIGLPSGLVESSRLDAPIFTPSTKAEIGDHDENISFERTAEIVGAEVAEKLRDTSVAVYSVARELAAARGIIIADTKFEFGSVEGQLTLVDEVLTPDSSRFWPADTYEPGRSQPSFDKQYVRDWLEASGWDKTPPAPALPPEVVEATSAKYIQAYELITGRSFEPEGAA